ncbi:MACPF domain-containing protein CAD1 [Selaginella moellendorffii]|uniref:MACPF domain-containing protein CAD1 n=1 Tax=Selaginella moellendorffii TaxID=88036 RepID=UPI000D1C2604|nr:MACPF domain-containing protein CAD1 [Selaginella moellendorffii]|eukprot:XP_024531977.1 MACPF domain-containing protein CAD1 [Selaginella moellendorffii]
MAQEKTSAYFTASEAVESLGKGFDVTLDLRLAGCKGPSGRLVELDETSHEDLYVQDRVVIPNVSKDIRCDKGEFTHFRSEVLTFHQMSERFNQELSITGKMPLGLFNTMYSFNGPWQADASTTKSLALDGRFITSYKLQIVKSPLVLREEVKKAVPASWDPAALAKFIDTYGTHIIVSIKVGGKDVVYVRQHQSSPLSPTELQKFIKRIADQKFAETNGPVSDSRNIKDKMQTSDLLAGSNHAHRLQLETLASSGSFTAKEDVEIIFRRRGGSNLLKSHNEWLKTVADAPDVISMTFVPITSLLNGVLGSGFLSHAVNLYLRHKPPIEDLQYFLEFQIPRQWSPGFDLPLGPQRKEPVCPAMQFSLMGPKLYVSSAQVTIGRRPVTGLRLFLEGKKCNRLGIHLQHLSSLPKILQPHWDSNVPIGPPVWKGPEEQDSKWFEPVQWKSFSHVSTQPVEFLEESYVGQTSGTYIVTGAQLGVWDFGMKKVLFLRLLFSRVPGCAIRRTVWDHSPTTSQKSGLFSQLGLSSTFSGAQKAKPAPVVLNSAVYPGGPPVPVPSPKLLKYVDITEMTKGAHDMPGHWIVTGAKLDVDRGRIALRLKYSVLHY